MLGPSLFSYSFFEISGLTVGLTPQHPLHEITVFPVQTLQIYSSKKHSKKQAEDLLLIRFKRRKKTFKAKILYATP